MLIIDINSNGREIGKLELDKWQFFCVSHNSEKKPLKLQVIIDNEVKKYIADYPKSSSGAVCKEEAIFENVAGAVSSVLVFTSAMRSDEIMKISAKFPKGVHDMQSVDELSKLDINREISDWSIINVHERAGKGIFDQESKEMNKNNCGVYIAMKEFPYLDPVQNLTPFFHIVTLLEESYARKLLNSTLSLCCIYLKTLYMEHKHFENYNTMSSSLLRFIKEAKCFIRTLGFHLLHYDPSLPDEDTIGHMGDIMAICPYLQKKMLKLFATTMNFWVNISVGSLTLFWEPIKTNLILNEGNFSIINVKVIIDVMEAMSSSLKGLPCCNVHFDESVSYSLWSKYESMTNLLKFIIKNNSINAIQSIQRIVHLLDQRPCSCLFLALVTVLKDVSERDSEYLTFLCKMDGLPAILKSAQGYPTDVKLLCIALAAAAFNQKDKDIIDMDKIKDSLATMITGSPRRISIKFTKNQESPNKSDMKRANSLSPNASAKLSELRSSGKITERIGRNASIDEYSSKENRKRINSDFEAKDLRKDSVSIAIMESEGRLSFNRMRSTTEDNFNTMEEEKYQSNVYLRRWTNDYDREILNGIAKNPFAVDSVPKQTEEAHSTFSHIDTLYNSILLWLIGKRPEQALTWKAGKPIIAIEDKPIIKNPEIFPIFLPLLTPGNNDTLIKRCLKDFTILCKSDPSNIQHMINNDKFSEWIIHLESYYYKETNFDSETLKSAFQLHLEILSETLKSADGMAYLTSYFLFWCYSIHPKNAKGKPLIERKEKSEESVWACLKYMYYGILNKANDLTQVAAFLRITVNLIMAHYLVKGKGIKIPHYFSENSDPIDSFKVSGLRLIARALDSLLKLCYTNNEFLSSFEFETICKKNGLDLNIKILDDKSDKGVQLISKEHGYINFAIILLSIGLNNCESSELVNWLAKAKALAQHIGLLMEYANKKGHAKIAKSANKNLLLLLSLLIYHSAVNRKHTKELSRTLCDIMLYIFLAAEELGEQMKDFLRKTLKFDETTIQQVFADIKKCTPAKEELFKVEQLYVSKSIFLKEYERVSYSSFEILKTDFKKMGELVLRKREAASKTRNNKFNIKQYFPKLISRRNSAKEELVVITEAYKDEAIAQLLHNQVRIAKWARKWIKTQKHLKQWQGAWRDYSIFDGPAGVSSIPLKLSSHAFGNGARCLMKIRNKRTECVAAESFPKSATELFCSEDAFTLLSKVCLQHNSRFDFTDNVKEKNTLWGCDYSLVKDTEDIAQTLYNEIPQSVRKQLMEPLSCEIYTPIYAKKGKILIWYKKPDKGYYIKFVLTREKAAAEDERLMFTFSYKPDMKLVKKWKVRDIEVAYKKYIVDQKSALEVFFITGKSVLFNFANEADRDRFCNKLLGIRKVRIEYSSKTNKSLIKDLMVDWINWKISNFDYLMALNNLSGRSFNNVSQYPVFPWVLNDSSSTTLDLTNEKVYRSMGENVGMLGDEVRAENFKERYNSDDLAGMGKFHFGTHYSNPGIIFQFMMRTSPFIEAYIKFFSGLDHADRMFHSIEESLASSKQDPNDVRELIPEFFSCPDIFINRESLCFGKREDSKIDVHDVILPAWARGTAYHYVELQREALESDYTSRNLSKWIDLIFGYQQQGKEAEKACNVFPKLSYDAEAILTKATGPQRDSYKMQAYHWGQTPMQLLMAKHKEKISKDPNLSYSILDKKTKVKYTEKGPGEKSIPESSTRKRVIKIFVYEDPHKDPSFALVTIDGVYVDYFVEITEADFNGKSQTKAFTPLIVRSTVKTYQSHYYENGVVTLSPLIESHYPVILIRKHGTPYLVQGGYINGTIQFTQLGSTPKSFSYKIHRDAVTCLEVDKEENIVVSGSASGEVIIFEIVKEMQWTPKRHLWHHCGPITHIFMSDEMQLLSTAGSDGVVNLYSYAGKLMQKFLHPLGFPIRFVLFINI